jgi:hypothetical protein
MVNVDEITPEITARPSDGAEGMLHVFLDPTTCLYLSIGDLLFIRRR